MWNKFKTNNKDPRPWYGKLRVTSYELQVASCELLVTSWSLKNELKFKSASSTPRVTSSNSRVTSSILRVTSSNLLITSSKPRVPKA